MNPDKPGTQTS